MTERHPERGDDDPIAVNRWRRRDGEEEREVILRLTDRCNLRCTFCQVRGLRFRPPAAFVRSAIRRQALTGGAVTLSLSGGEPTLDPRLPGLVAWALGFRVLRVSVQTNAVRFAEPGYASLFPRADRLFFFVSFHGHTRRLYDAATATTGRFDAAVRGIRNLLDGGHPVILNYVVTRENVAHLPALVRSLPRLFPRRRGRLALNLSTLSQFPGMDERTALLPRLTDVLRRSRAAATEARRIRLPYYDFLRTGACALPPCVLTRAERRRIQAVGVCAPRAADRTAAPARLESAGDAPRVKAASCRRCAFDADCGGVPRAYATTFGLGELVPVVAEDG
jgi:MoaA/NifB/PqqE/SkfB family radical SAM enzyme